jgi:stage II sporulation protein D
MKRSLHLVALFALALGLARGEEKQVRIGVLGLFHAKEIVVSPVLGDPLQCSSGAESWQVSAPVHVELRDAKLMKVATVERPVAGPFVCDNGQGGAAELAVTVPGKISRRYHGKLEISAEPRELRVVIAMELETAVASIVAAESVPRAPMEALKAQAVAARSFLLAGQGRHGSFDFCDTTHCQFLRSPPASQTPAFQATLATRGLVLSYKDEVFAAMYSASCGGRTHTLEELGIPVRGYPYFSVTCDYCRRHPEKWVTQIEPADAANLTPTERSRLNLVRKLGWKAVPGNSYSSRTENGVVILEGVGIGHGIGLCQRGGAAMARAGASFQQILEHYYPNAEVKHY